MRLMILTIMTTMAGINFTNTTQPRMALRGAMSSLTTMFGLVKVMIFKMGKMRHGRYAQQLQRQQQRMPASHLLQWAAMCAGRLMGHLRCIATHMHR